MSEDNSRVTKLFGKLEPRKLAWIFGVLFVINLIVPDPVPFIDEALLGILTLILANWRTGKQPPAGGGDDKPPMKNVTPRQE